MDVWWTILLCIIGFTLFFLLMSVFANLLIAWSARRFSKNTLNKSLEDIEKMLPGKNCGKCGYSTCKEYAHQILYNPLEAVQCPEGSEELPEQLAKYMESFEKKLETAAPKDKDRYNPR